MAILILEIILIKKRGKQLSFVELIDNQGKKESSIKIMIFTEGTILGPKNVLEHFNICRYIPIKNCVNKIQAWEKQGADIIYATSAKRLSHVERIANNLRKYGLYGTRLYYRGAKEKYKDIAKAVRPDILIEDDCKSIGGAWQMCITYVQPDIKRQIKSIIVKEFTGIDDLPDSLYELKKYVL